MSTDGLHTHCRLELVNHYIHVSAYGYKMTHTYFIKPKHIIQSLLYEARDPYAVFVFISIASPFLFLLLPTSSYTVDETCDPYAVLASISMASPFIFLLVPTSYTVAGSACELGLCDDSLDPLEM